MTVHLTRLTARGAAADFGMVLGALDTPGRACRSSGVLFFEKITFFLARFGFGMIFLWFWVVLRSILGAEMLPKWVENWIEKVMDFWTALGRALGRQRAAGRP